MLWIVYVCGYLTGERAFLVLQVTTVTKVVREVHAVGPDGQPLGHPADYAAMPAGYPYHMAGPGGPTQEPYPSADAGEYSYPQP